jgi:hypothetical protein
MLYHILGLNVREETGIKSQISPLNRNEGPEGE